MNHYEYKPDQPGTNSAFTEKMRKAGIPEQVINLFNKYLHRLSSDAEQEHFIREHEIQPLEEQDLPDHHELTREDEDFGRSILDRAVMLKLNGGLGTSMGMPHAKSLLTVREDYTFLDIILEQARIKGKSEQGEGSLILMNSPNTDNEIREHLELTCYHDNLPLIFNQHVYPKVLADSLEPAVCPGDPQLEWNPPGHGDLFASLLTSGMLEYLLDQGKRYAFVSNADNLGASIDPAILGYFARNRFSLLMEVAKRTSTDKKGGHLAKYTNGQLVLREGAQCSEADREYFQDVNRHRFFNTNNIWLDLQILNDYIQREGLPELPLIVNPKNLNPRDEDSPRVYQLETAMGSAVSVFERSSALKVGRNRFIPVKKTNDLLAIRSDCYVLNKYFELSPNPERELGPIEIDLDEAFYKKVDQFEDRFPWGPPSLIGCESIKVNGDVLFEDNVLCRGKVEIINSSGTQKKVPRGSELSGRIVLD
ncbi:MAG: UTP--glucose-1-phosphate uridylyltransferase [Thermodesulfobacteriota bacterium]